ncbi:MAG: hypothetical protein P4L50_21465 [Anaerolineaceae bacterium]|nr:hypothetical protein [Anaerolineaceae bacterium]
MEKLFGVLICSLALLYALYSGYSVWFEPKQFLKRLHNRRTKFKSRIPFLPDWLINFGFFNNQPFIALWLGRVLTIIFIVMCILGVIAIFNGPS